MPITVQLPASAIAGSYGEMFVDLASAAGTITQMFTAVPAGQVWVVQSACCWDHTSDIGMCKIRKASGGSSYVLAVKNPAGTDDAAQITCPVLLLPGEYLDFQWATVVLNDDIFAHATGVKFAIELF